MQDALNIKAPSRLQLIDYDLFNRFDIKVYLKRDDLLHPEISGNKWRKLKLNIEKYKQGKYDRILTFGGAYSNHISATAAVGKGLGIKTIGIIRGEELTADSNETLRVAQENGMKLVFVSREEYSWRYEKDYKNALRTRFGNVLVIEEGGANYLGVMGCTEIVSEIDFQPDYYFLAAGTGTTTAGILTANQNSQVITVPVFKKGDFIKDDIAEMLAFTGLTDEELAEKMNLLDLALEFHFGGYGKFNIELIDFINHIYEKTKIPLDQIYTGKMFYALCAYIKSGKIKPGSRVVAIHTGGLQGTASIKDQLRFN